MFQEKGVNMRSQQNLNFNWKLHFDLEHDLQAYKWNTKQNNLQITQRIRILKLIGFIHVETF